MTWLHRAAEEQGIPPRSLDQVKAALERAKKNDADMALARAMLRHGRLTEDARRYVGAYCK